MYYEKIFETFQKEKVEYLIAGGMAVNLYGIPRFTKDLDILIDPSPPNLGKLESALRSLGFKPKAPVPFKDFFDPQNWEKWKIEKGMVAFNFYNAKNSYEEIDILIGSPLSYKDAVKHVFSMKLGGLTLHLVSIDDLIKMKKVSGRKQDESDIEALKKIKKAGKK